MSPEANASHTCEFLVPEEIRRSCQNAQLCHWALCSVWWTLSQLGCPRKGSNVLIFFLVQGPFLVHTGHKVCGSATLRLLPSPLLLGNTNLRCQASLSVTPECNYEGIGPKIVIQKISEWYSNENGKLFQCNEN